MYTPNVNKKIHETLCDIRKNNNNSDVVVAFIQIDTDTSYSILKSKGFTVKIQFHLDVRGIWWCALTTFRNTKPNQMFIIPQNVTGGGGMIVMDGS